MRNHPLKGRELSGWAIRSARDYRGVQSQELADIISAKLGRPFHRNTLIATEKGRRSPTGEELSAIADALEWPVEWLVRGPRDIPTGDLGVRRRSRGQPRHTRVQAA